MLFHTPDLDDQDRQVLSELDNFRQQLRHILVDRRRWTGQLRRNLIARAIQGSNSIEGYDVALDDALALLEDEEPLDADRRTVLEITGYRNAMTYVQQLANDEHFHLDASLVRSLHFMMLGHDLSKSPGQYRKAVIFVFDEANGQIVYEGPDADKVPDLVEELVATLGEDDGACSVFVKGAMAHLNLVMIHPFRDGNGRMARSLQTLMLARERILAPEFSSIEEWLGRNTQAYYAILADVGAGTWHPERDAHAWVRFNLRAHHIQAQTVRRRVDETARLWIALTETASRRGLPDDRVVYALYEAAHGLRVRRATYAAQTELEPGAASRDLRLMVDAGLLDPQGETRGRFYIGTPELRALRDQVRVGRAPLTDPYRSDQTLPVAESAPRRVLTNLG